MAGHMGDRQRTIQNLQVVAVDEDRGLIFIKGYSITVKPLSIRLSLNKGAK